MEIVLIALTNILCFVVGARIGMASSKGESITLNPVKAVKEHKAKAEAHKAQDMMDTILQNIENYSGSSSGQKDIPRG
jgi:RNase H-fold protein (predicted Holliday junction resolvase)